MALWELGRQARDAHIGCHFDDGDENLETRLRTDPSAGDFVRGFDDVLALFGFHGPNELELSAPKWGSHPHLALRIIERLRHAPDGRDPRVAAERLAAARAEATERVTAQLPKLRRRLFRLIIRNAGIYAREREATKAALVRALFPSHLALNELAARHGIDRDDIYLLLDKELESAIGAPDSYHATIAERRALRDGLQRRRPPFWFEGEVPDPAGWAPRRQVTADPPPGNMNLHGLGVSSGVATGRARVILDPNDPVDLEPDEILVAPQTDPAWTPLFLGAAGVIVEYGAVMSHAGIVARELGIPAVVGVDGATTDITTGSRVTIDGKTGEVTVVVSPQ
jgi:pyruvate,water dikinase